MKRMYSLLLLGLLFFANIVIAAKDPCSENAGAWSLVCKDNPAPGENVICKLIDLLTVVGAISVTGGATLAAYKYISPSESARQEAKLGLEGILLGGGLISLAPRIAGIIFGYNIC